MKTSRFSEQQIAFILEQAEDGTTVEEICRKVSISIQTYYRWRSKHGGVIDGGQIPCHLGEGKTGNCAADSPWEEMSLLQLRARYVSCPRKHEKEIYRHRVATIDDVQREIFRDVPARYRIGKI